MTIRDVARHLNVGWDLIKEIQKRDLLRRYAKLKWSVSQITSWLACSFTYAAEAARKCGDARFSQFSMSCRVNLHANGFGVRLLNSSYHAKRTRIASSFAKSFGVNTFLWMIEK